MGIDGDDISISTDSCNLACSADSGTFGFGMKDKDHKDLELW